jgi:hypothetical protein
VYTRLTQPRAWRFQRAHNLKPVVMIVNDVKMHVRTSKTPPSDSSGGRGLGGLIADIKNSYIQVAISIGRSGSGGEIGSS